MHRRSLVIAGLGLAAGGCAVDEPIAPPPRPRTPRGDSSLEPWRSIAGGFLAPPGGLFGVPARPATGPYVRLIAPEAIALRGNDLLVADLGAGRLLRCDLAFESMSPLPAAPVSRSVQLALGPDLSVWVLDGIARQVLRFARDGRLMQTFRDAFAAPSPVGFTLADGGATLLVADEAARQWVEFRPAGSVAIAMRPGDGSPLVRSIAGIASTGDEVFLLDRLAGVVHVARRSGVLLSQLGEGQLKQPVAIAADRFGRVWVHDAQDAALKLLVPGRATQVFDAARLRVQQIGGFAVDERQLAVADRLGGRVQIHLVEAVS